MVTSFIAFAASSIIFCGTFIGSDYSMVVEPEGHAHVDFTDGTTADIQFNTVIQYPDNNIARGIVIGTTSPTHMQVGDTVNLSSGMKSIVVSNPEGRTRLVRVACWAGFNSATGC